MTDEIVYKDNVKRVPMRYSGKANNISAQEAELAALEAERDAALGREPAPKEIPEVTGDTSTTTPEPEGSEEQTFKKRYADLRRYQQTKETEYKDRVAALERQVASAASNALQLPESEEEIDAFRAQYPDAAKAMDMVADKKAREVRAELEARFKEVDELKRNTAAEKSALELKKLHPDVDDLKNDPAFHEWVAEQTDRIKDALYVNELDYRDAARAIDLYKLDKGISKKPKADGRSAAETVNRGSRIEEPKPKIKVRESDLDKMSLREYAAREAEIDEARKHPEFYDKSGAAR